MAFLIEDSTDEILLNLRMLAESTFSVMSASLISPSTSGILTIHSLSVSADIGLAIQIRTPRKWEWGASSVLGCRSARINYLNTSLTECMKQFNIKQCESFCQIEGRSLKALSRLHNVTEEKSSRGNMYTTERDHAKAVIDNNTECARE